MKRAFLYALLPFVAALPLSEAQANERDRKFFESVEGEWVGPGEIVAGKYKGTKFTCTLKGSTPSGAVGMSLDGGCRVGMFTQKMSAKVQKRGKGYSGTFLDGAKGKGLDIVSGSVNGSKVTFALNRASLKGAMLARLPSENTMNVTVSVRVDNEMVPVIGMSLKRVDGSAVGSVAQN
ncbi:MAG TPA: hypothetical protein VMF90_05540 [Rhizobiaceae bacterium]|jgi:hypothetical protein|nr:hypothetical protein [Rhizobiaceae bacterium]